jgi:hypothetical protein
MIGPTFPAGLTVGFEYASAPASRLIEYVESGAGPSHVTTLVAPGEVIDARFRGGVARRPVSYFGSTPVVWYRLAGTTEAVKASLALLEAQIGEPYDWQDILAFAVPTAFRALTGARHPWMCSYLASAAQVAGGFLHKPPVGLERINPFELWCLDWGAGAIELPGPVFD